MFVLGDAVELGGDDRRLTSARSQEIIILLRVLEFTLNRPHRGQMTPTRVFTC
jgi:hypothetical protein